MDGDWSDFYDLPISMDSISIYMRHSFNKICLDRHRKGNNKEILAFEQMPQNLFCANKLS